MNNENFDPNQEAAAPQTPEDPAQTPPTPQDSYSYPPLPRTRRIGTLTMGFALIVTGIIALVATFYPAFDIFTVLKLSPIIFVFLGLEILIGISAIREKSLNMTSSVVLSALCSSAAELCCP